MRLISKNKIIVILLLIAGFIALNHLNTKKQTNTTPVQVAQKPSQMTQVKNLKSKPTISQITKEEIIQNFKQSPRVCKDRYVPVITDQKSGLRILMNKSGQVVIKNNPCFVINNIFSLRHYFGYEFGSIEIVKAQPLIGLKPDKILEQAKDEFKKRFPYYPKEKTIVLSLRLVPGTANPDAFLLDKILPKNFGVEVKIIDKNQFTELLSSKMPVIDVRSSPDYKNDFIPGTKNYSGNNFYSFLYDKKSWIQEYKERPFVIFTYNQYDLSFGEYLFALKRAGFKQIYWYYEGYEGFKQKWKKRKGFPKRLYGHRYLVLEKVNEYHKNPNSLFIDVRNKETFRSLRIKDAIHFEDIYNKVVKIKKDILNGKIKTIKIGSKTINIAETPLIIYGRTSSHHHPQKMFKFFFELGFNAFYYPKGFAHWLSASFINEFRYPCEGQTSIDATKKKLQLY